MESFNSSTFQKARPKLYKPMASRKTRLILSTSIASFLLFSLFRNYQALSTLAAAQGRHLSIPSSKSEIVENTDWSKFAYIQYATNGEYLCNSVMLFESLHQLESRPDRVLMYPSHMVDPNAAESNSVDGKLVLKARDEYGAHLVPISIQHRDGDDREFPPFAVDLLPPLPPQADTGFLKQLGQIPSLSC